jgi:hypothetical protein
MTTKKPRAKPSKDPETKLLAKARAAAKKFKLPEQPISRSEALSVAPWDDSNPPVFERSFREAFANALEVRGAARAAKPGGKSGASGLSLLGRRTLRQTEQEFADNDAKAKAAGLNWNTWVRRQLAK